MEKICLSIELQRRAQMSISYENFPFSSQSSKAAF